MSLSDEFQKRQEQTPDRFTLAWWQEQFAEVNKGYRGATHGINRALADYADCSKAIEELRQRCDTLERERNEAFSKIGELQAEMASDRKEFEKLLKRFARHAEFLTELKAERENGANGQ